LNKKVLTNKLYASFNLVKLSSVYQCLKTKQIKYK